MVSPFSVFGIEACGSGGNRQGFFVGIHLHQVADGAAGSFEQAIVTIQPVANAVIERFQIRLIMFADEVEVKVCNDLLHSASSRSLVKTFSSKLALTCSVD